MSQFVSLSALVVLTSAVDVNCDSLPAAVMTAPTRESCVDLPKSMTGLPQPLVMLYNAPVGTGRLVSLVTDVTNKWTAFGVGTNMADADVVIARTDTAGDFTAVTASPKWWTWASAQPLIADLRTVGPEQVPKISMTEGYMRIDWHLERSHYTTENIVIAQGPEPGFTGEDSVHGAAGRAIIVVPFKDGDIRSVAPKCDALTAGLKKGGKAENDAIREHCVDLPASLTTMNNDMTLLFGKANAGGIRPFTLVQPDTFHWTGFGTGTKMVDASVTLVRTSANQTDNAAAFTASMGKITAQSLDGLSAFSSAAQTVGDEDLPRAEAYDNMILIHGLLNTGTDETKPVDAVIAVGPRSAMKPNAVPQKDWHSRHWRNVGEPGSKDKMKGATFKLDLGLVAAPTTGAHALAAVAALAAALML